MLKTAQRTYARYDAINKLNSEEFISGKIPASRVRTMFTTPITVIPGLDAPTPASNPALGIGTFFIPIRFLVWKPVGLGYVGAVGNLLLKTSSGANTLSYPYAAILASNNADAACVLVSGALSPATGLDKFTLSFSGADPTGDGPPLYYACFFTRYSLTCPLQLS